MFLVQQRRRIVMMMKTWDLKLGIHPIGIVVDPLSHGRKGGTKIMKLGHDDQEKEEESVSSESGGDNKDDYDDGDIVERNCHCFN